MKRNLLGLAAVVFAVVLSSFTARFNSTFYMVYNSGAQKDMINYQSPTTTIQDAVEGSDILAWVSIESVDASITQTEFEHAFDALDETAPSSDNLDDESEKTRSFEFDNVSNLQVVLEKKEL